MFPCEYYNGFPIPQELLHQKSSCGIGEPLKQNTNTKPILPAIMEEEICHIEILRVGDQLVANVQTALGGVREYEGPTFEETLRQLVIDLQQEFDRVTLAGTEEEY